MRLSCNFVNVYTIAYRVQYIYTCTCVHVRSLTDICARILARKIAHVGQVGEDPCACSARGERSYSRGKLNIREVAGHVAQRRRAKRCSSHQRSCDEQRYHDAKLRSLWPRLRLPTICYNMLCSSASRSAGCQGEDWKSVARNLSTEVGSKMDRLEFAPFRDEMEERLRVVAAKLASLQRTCHQADDTAAGIRKQLLQRFNCLSCDRPVKMMPHKYIIAVIIVVCGLVV